MVVKDQKPANPMGAAFFNEGGEFWVERNSPSPHFYVFWCKGARLGELTMHIFFKTKVRALWVGIHLLEAPRVN